jgi:hypothetical protein
VLAKLRHELDVEVIEWRDAIEMPRPCEVTHRAKQRGSILEVGHTEYFIDVFAAPRLVEQRLLREKDNRHSLALAPL